jgi:hypothetical protein
MYQIDLRTKAITQSNATRSPVSGETAHPHDIPELIDRAITHGSLANEYELSFRVNPFHLRGDFNGDGKIDVAALVKQRSTGKVGIAIINGATDEVTIFGAGTASETGVMTSNGWIPGRSTPRTEWPGKQMSRSFMVTYFL